MRPVLAAAAVATTVGAGAWLMQAVLGRVVPNAPYETWGGVFRLVEGELFLVLIGVAYATAHRWPVEGRQHWRRVVAQLALGLVVSFVFGAIIHALAPTLRPWWFAKRGGEIVGSSAKDAMFGYALASGLAYGVVRWRAQRARQIAALDARRRATAAQLDLLALDLQPQAVLRTMDVLAELIPRDPDVANEGLVMLATSLGATMDAMRAGGLTLEAEMAHVQAIVRLHAITTGLVIALRVPGEEPPSAVVAWADRQPPALARVDVEPRSRTTDGGAHHWALYLRVPWRELATGERSEDPRLVVA